MGFISNPGGESPAYALLTVKGFQFNPAFGTVAGPANLNDDNTGNSTNSDTIGKYAQVDFPGGAKLTQFRHFGNVGNAENGEWKIQYLNANGDWIDWVTGISTRAAASFTSWIATGGEIEASALKLVTVAVDTGSGGESRIAELEVKF